GCSATVTETTDVVVNTPPTPSFISGATTVCFNDIETYITEPGNTNYIWTFTGGTLISGGGASQPSITIRWDGAAPYEVGINYTDANGCSAAAPTVLAVNVISNTLSLTQTPDPGLCAGSSIEIAAITGYDTYEFRDGAGGPVLQAASADNTFDATTFTDGQVIEVEAVSATCGTVTETITLNISASPSLLLTQTPDPGCSGSSVEVSATPGFDTYEFRDGVGGPVLQAASTDNTFDATTFTDGQVIEVEAVSTACGTLLETITLSINSLPTLTLSQSPDPGCVGSTVEITAAPGYDTYEFRNGVGGPVLQAASADNTFDATTFTDGQVIEVEAFSAICGVFTETLVISIDNVSALTLLQDPNPGTCAGTSIELTATAGYDTYEFRDGIGGPVLQAASADNTFDATTFTDGQ
ncbi:hypothetical protein, partial [Fulvivirga kasyanovii]